MEEHVDSILGVAFAIGGSVVAWLVADTRSKARMGFMDEKVAGHAKELGSVRKDADIAGAKKDMRLAALEIKSAECEAAQRELHRAVERIEEQKASKELFDSFRTEVTTMRQDMDRRFDRLERLILKQRDNDEA